MIRFLSLFLTLLFAVAASAASPDSGILDQALKGSRSVCYGATGQSGSSDGITFRAFFEGSVDVAAVSCFDTTTATASQVVAATVEFSRSDTSGVLGSTTCVGNDATNTSWTIVEGDADSKGVPSGTVFKTSVTNTPNPGSQTLVLCVAAKRPQN